MKVGEPSRGYDDGGYSGGTRELKHLLDDVAAKKVDTIVVYKVDRLTRRLADFAKIVEPLDARRAPEVVPNVGEYLRHLWVDVFSAGVGHSYSKLSYRHWVLDQSGPVRLWKRLLCFVTEASGVYRGKTQDKSAVVACTIDAFLLCSDSESSNPNPNQCLLRELGRADHQQGRERHSEQHPVGAADDQQYFGLGGLRTNLEVSARSKDAGGGSEL